MDIRRLALMVCAGCVLVHADVSDRLKELCGEERVKVVWARSETNLFGFEKNWGTQQVLVGFDSERATEDTIVAELSNYQRPLITYAGCHVVYSNATDTGVYIVDWAGESPPRRLTAGVAGCLWYDTATGLEYVYFAEQHEGRTRTPVRRLCIADTTDNVIVFNENSALNVNGQWLCVNADTSLLGCVWGWPTCRAYPTAGGRYVINESGCWTSMPYTAAWILCRLNDDHTGVVVNRHEGDENEIPTGVINQGRIASYSDRFFCAAVGMSDEGGDEGGQICIMRLDTGLTTVEDTVMVTEVVAAQYDGLPDMWSGPSMDTCGQTGLYQTAPESLRCVGHGGTTPASSRLYDLSGRTIRSGATSTAATSVNVDDIRGRHMRRQ